MPPVPSVAQSNIGQPGQQNQPQSYFQPSPTLDKGPDYVYFERRPNQFAEETRGKATAAKMKLELYYKEAVEGVVGRKER